MQYLFVRHILFAPVAQGAGWAAVLRAGAEYEVEPGGVNAQGREPRFAVVELEFAESQAGLQLRPGRPAVPIHALLAGDRRGRRHVAVCPVAGLGFAAGVIVRGFRKRGLMSREIG